VVSFGVSFRICFRVSCRILICNGRAGIAVIITAIATMVVYRAATFTKAASLTYRFAVSAIVAINAIIVAVTSARLTNFGKVEGEVIVWLELIIRIRLIKRVNRFRNDFYHSRYECVGAAPAATSAVVIRLAPRVSHSCSWMPIAASSTVRGTLSGAVRLPNPTM